MRIFVFVLAASLAGCGSSTSSVSDVPASSVTAPIAPQSLSGRWEGPGVQLRLNESNGLVQGTGSVRRGSEVVPVDVTGELKPDGQVLSVLLPHDDTPATDNLAANGQLAQGVLHLSIGDSRSVELRPAAEPQLSVTQYQVSASPYNLSVDLGSSRWRSSPSLLFGADTGFTYVETEPDGTLSVGLQSDRLLVGILRFPAGGGALVSPSYVVDSGGNEVRLHGQADAGASAALGPPPQATGSPGTPPDVSGVWTGPDFQVLVNQAGSSLAAVGIYRQVPVRGSGTAGQGGAVLHLNSSGGSDVDGVTIVRHPDGHYTVTDSLANSR